MTLPEVGSLVSWEDITWTVEACDTYEGHVHLTVPLVLTGAGKKNAEKFMDSRHRGWPCTYTRLDLLDAIERGEVKPVKKRRRRSSRVA